MFSCLILISYVSVLTSLEFIAFLLIRVYFFCTVLLFVGDWHSSFYFFYLFSSLLREIEDFFFFFSDHVFEEILLFLSRFMREDFLREVCLLSSFLLLMLLLFSFEVFSLEKESWVGSRTVGNKVVSYPSSCRPVCALVS